MAVALCVVVSLDLLSALLAGLLIAQLVHSTAPLLRHIGIADHRIGKAVALGLVAAIITIALVLAIVAISSWLTAGPENLFFLMQRMAEAIGSMREHLPGWASSYLPANVEEFEAAASKWLRDNAWQLRFVGRDIGLFLTHTIVGMIIGGMVAYSRDIRDSDPGPLAAALEERVKILGNAFRSIVFSQVRISALNTTLTAIYLGRALAFVRRLPAVRENDDRRHLHRRAAAGDRQSHLQHRDRAGEPERITRHRGRFARLPGGHPQAGILRECPHHRRAQIRARAWELLLAMLVMDAAFGIPGLIAAPIYYAYVKDELTLRKLI